MWAQILKNEKTKLLLKNSLIGGEDIKNNVLKILSKGIKENRSYFRERKNEDHLNLYNKAHVALDTFPYPGSQLLRGNSYGCSCSNHARI